MSKRFGRRIPLACILVVLATACASRVVPPPPEVDVLERDTYVIGHSDVLRIDVWKQPELSVANVPVRPDGKISVPLIDDVQAAGLTPEELKELLTKAMAEYVTAPDVTVLVIAINSKTIHLMGEIVRPNAYIVSRDMRVLDALAVAGGFTAYSNKRRIKILRPSPAGIAEYRFDYEAYLDGKTPEANILLYPGDTIVVPD